MARIRGIKPDFFKDEDLACLPFEARLFYEGLWCFADKSGRLEYRPKYLKAEIFPYDEIDVVKLLHLLSEPNIPGRPKKAFIRVYEVGGRQYIDIPEFSKHQSPHHTEKDSILPEYNATLTVKKPLRDGESPEDTVKIPVQIQDTVKKQEREYEGKPKAPTYEPEKKKGNGDGKEFLKEAAEIITQIREKKPSPHFNRDVQLFLECNIRAHPKAIIHCLSSLLKNLEDIQAPKPYLEAALKIENGKYNARDHDDAAQEYKKPVEKGELSALGNIIKSL